MADMEQLERELLVRHPERWVRHHLASFPADYFRVFDSTEVSRHLEAMLTLTDDRPVHVRAESECGGVWRVDVVGYDAFQFLSTVCTLLAVSGLSISGWAGFHVPASAAGSHCFGSQAGSGPEASRAAVGPEWTGPSAQDRRCLSGPPAPRADRRAGLGEVPGRVARSDQAVAQRQI